MDGCRKPLSAKGFCVAHYARWKRTGDPGPAKVQRRRPKGKPPLICRVDGCERAVNCRGLCKTHYSRWLRTGRTERPAKSTVCAVDGCSGAVLARGWCGIHYGRWHAFGDPLAEPTRPREYPLTDGRVCEACGKDLVRKYFPSGGLEPWEKFQKRACCDRTCRKVATARAVELRRCSKCGVQLTSKNAKGLCSVHYREAHKAGLFATEKCAESGCGELAIKRGFCAEHYQAWYVKNAPRCSVEGCERAIRTRRSGLCNMHENRRRRLGAVGEAAPRIAPKGSGTIDSNGYRRITLEDGRTIAEHRYVMEQMRGRRLLPTETVHHKNGRRADNDPDNLELRAGAHGKHQRIEDLVADARETLARYGDEVPE